MNTDEVLAALQQHRRHPTVNGGWVMAEPLVTRFGSSQGGWAGVAYSDLTPENADLAIDEEIAYFRSREQAFEWTVYDLDEPPDLLERLRRKGFEIGPKEAIMIYDLEDGLEPLMQGTKHEVRRVQTFGDLEDFRSVAEEAFGKNYDRTIAELGEAIAAGSTDHLGYVAYDGEQPVSVGRLYAGDGCVFGGLYGGATVPSHRGRGFYRAIIAARAREAHELGARYLRVDALPTSRPILEQLGFAHVADSWPCEHA